MEQDAVPAGLANTHARRSGGAGAPPAGTKTGREELADGERYPSQDGSAAESAARRRNDTAMERRGARVLLFARRTTHRKVQSNGRLAALHPLGFHAEAKGEGRPPRASNNRADGACALPRFRPKLPSQEPPNDLPATQPSVTWRR